MKKHVVMPGGESTQSGCLLALAGLNATLTVLLFAKGHWVIAAISLVTLFLFVLPLLRRALVIRAARAFLAARGATALLVYSDSPHWKAYIDERWLSRLRDRLVVLNWSRRQGWDPADPMVRLFRLLVGETYEFNPAVVILEPWQNPFVLRFYQAFRNARHGNREGLEMLERQLFERLGESHIKDKE